jgi:protein arginine kinase
VKESEKGISILEQRQPWENNNNSVWLASTINLSRNFEKFNFPPKLELEKRKQIVALVSKDLLATNLLQNPTLLKAEDIGPLEKEFLVEHFLSNQNYNQTHVGEAFVVDNSGTFLAVFNLRDHLHLELIDCQGELENAWNKLIKIETAIGKSLGYSFSPRFGFLTADPAICGTALIVSNYLQVPGLVHTEKLEEILDKYGDESIALTGIQGNPTEIIGDVLVVQNNYTLGLTEENIISTLRSFTTKLLVEENATRNHIRHSASPDIKDKVSRAFGILIHSYQIEAAEALNAISLLKLGAELGWVRGISTTTLNLLFFNCRRSHLLCQFPEKIPQEEIIHKRAEFIHKVLKDVHLAI